jgi:antitoxin (DNA-binding transcriptional repressor) of toxin-antitoxin stability system
MNFVGAYDAKTHLPELIERVALLKTIASAK